MQQKKRTKSKAKASVGKHFNRSSTFPNKILNSNRISYSLKMIIGVLLLPLGIVGTIIRVVYHLLIGIPLQRSRILGLFRTAFWIFILCYVDFNRLNESANDGNILLMLMVPILPFVCILILIFSVCVMFGLHLNMTRPYRKPIPGLENHPSIQSTIDILDSQLSSSVTRNDFIDKIIGKK